MTRPLWVDPEEQSYLPLAEDIEVDVAIVGGGFSGLGAAWALRETGASVAVLEGRTIASGASGRNAGFVLAGPAMGYGESVRAIGESQTAQIWDLTRRNHTLLVDIMDECGIECGYLRRGSMSLAASEDEWAGMLDDVQAMNVQGVSACVVERSALPRPFDPLYHGGIYYAGNGEIEPGLFLRGLATALARSVRLFESSRVDRLHMVENGWILHTLGGAVKAQSVVLATNAYTSTLLPDTPIAPVLGQVLATKPLGCVVVPFPMYAKHGYQYWRQTAGGVLVVGGWRDLDPDREIGTGECANERIQLALEGFASEVAGGRGVPEYRWAGVMGFTPDRLPLAGPVPGKRGLYIAAGYTGHGVAMAFQCGLEVARMAVGRDHTLPVCFDPARCLS